MQAGEGALVQGEGVRRSDKGGNQASQGGRNDQASHIEGAGV